MTVSLTLFAVFAFAALSVAGALFLFSARDGEKDPLLKARLERLAASGRTTGGPGRGPESVFREDFLQRSPLVRLLRLGLPGLSDLGARLERAGMTVAPGRFLRLWVLLFLLGALGGWVFLSGLPGFLLGASLGGLAPHLVLKAKTRRRMKAFEKQFPEALRLLATSLRAGHALTYGIRMLAEELPAPAGEEFRKVSEENGLGLRIEDALVNMRRRIENPDLPFFVTAVVIQRETGGNLAELLQLLDALVRGRFKIRGQVKALTAPGRLSGILLGLLPIGLGGVFTLINPGYMAPLWGTSAGRSMVLGAFLLQGLGYLVIRRIVNIRL